MNPRIYTYKVTFPNQGWWYWGVHKEKRFGEPYFGSPSTHKQKWKDFYFEVQILECFETEEEAYSVERRLIKPDLNNPNCLNENVGGNISNLGRSKAGRKNVESGHLQKISTLGGDKPGKKWFNNGLNEIKTFGECPEGFVSGRLISSMGMKGYDRSKRKWYNNGKKETLIAVCPDGWKPGRLK